MRRSVAVILMVGMILSLIAGCGGENGMQFSGPTHIVVDALGREVELPVKIDRIVPLGNTPRMITYLGLADKVVGYSGMDLDAVTPLTAYAYANKERWKDVSIVGTDSGGNTDYYPEQIIAAQPDVILCSYTEDIVNDLEAKTGIPVIAVGMGTLFADDYDEALRILGKSCGVEDRAEAVIAFIDSCLADLDERTAHIPEMQKPTVLSAAATFKGIRGIEGVRLQDPVLDAIHGNNIAAGSGGADAATVDREQILAWNPDYIFCDFGGVGLVKEDEKSDPAFYSQLTAYGQGQIYQHPSSNSYYSNLEISLLNCYFIGMTLYPTEFADVNFEKKAGEIFGFLLGCENYLAQLEDYGAYYGRIDFGA